MENWFDKKEEKHRKKANHSLRQDRGHIVKRKLANKNQGLVLDYVGDLHPDDGPRTVQCKEYPWNRQISSVSNCSDDDNVEQMVVETGISCSHFQFAPLTIVETSDMQVNELTEWLNDNKPLNVTSFSQKTYECYTAIHRDGSSIRSDLAKLMNNPPSQIFKKIITCLQAMPYIDKSFYTNNVLPESIQKFISEYKLTWEQEQRLHERRIHILNRFSFGFLLVHDDKFFLAAHRYGGNNLRIVKGQSNMKHDGTFETPWETAIRVTAEQLEYRCGENNEEWRAFDINEYKNKWMLCTYLECAFEEIFSKRYQRLMGIFVIKLTESITFRIKNYEYHQNKCQWISFDEELNKEDCYTAYPFIKFLQSNPDFLSN
ncbi:unnamed protein product [Rotaria magnacalcarata]|uniref:Uncharacterized protein n=1 Tax=Rotaria magnacalcarata TaxID=392030 RepID=A0A815Z7B3_9BILA|nr:unnamed protein product [Rotaria magnacalcarata]CAF1578881.1 unnamed protein product [Rotaria magnacalcarata]CAF2267904.1 unnamed protein product [Rotaria magnacalcarata]CAF3883250.1 unnamed protein product [Rotaria magnacalcarata]CAF3901340.1 unnamed protein product [Rotaria magnacalcarata]